jgi:hypothetical protein
MVLLYRLARDRNRQNGVMTVSNRAGVIHGFRAASAFPEIAGIFAHRPFRCCLGKGDVAFDDDLRRGGYLQIDGFALDNLDGLVEISTREIGFVKVFGEGHAADEREEAARS